MKPEGVSMIEFLLRKLDEEYAELNTEVAAYMGSPQYPNENLLREAADIGNIAMMLADACGQLKKI
jgi:hypothetical protein